MMWQHPWWRLLVLLAIPAWLLVRRTGGRVLYSSLRVLPQHRGTWRTALAWVPDVLFALAVASLAIALAGPRKGERSARIPAEGIGIVMAVDTSSSMAALDLSDRGSERTRLDAVKDVFSQFVIGNGGDLHGRPDDIIGLVSFAAYADTRSPLTLDHGNLAAAAKQVELTQAGSKDDGTAIGEGLSLAVERLIASPAKSKVVILLTDGDNNAGEISPDEAAAFAQQNGVTVYTIGAGTVGVAPIRVTDPDTGQSQLMQMQVHIDEDLLRSIAQKTGGKYFRADNAAALRAIYDEIDKLQPTHFEEDRFFEFHEYFELFVVIGLGLALTALALRATVLRRLP